jgi:hypothetical protein
MTSTPTLNSPTRMKAISIDASRANSASRIGWLELDTFSLFVIELQLVPVLSSEHSSQCIGREPIKPEALANVRFGAHNGLKPRRLMSKTLRGWTGADPANRISSIQRLGYQTIRRSATSNFRPEFATRSWPRGSRRLARSARRPTKRC